MTLRICIAIGILTAIGAAAAAHGNVVEFSEASPLPANLSSLNGSDVFEAEGLSFSGQTVFVADQRFVGAGNDPYGIATGTAIGPAIPTAVVNFATPLTSLTIDAISVGTDFIADVYHGDSLLETFSGTGSTGTTYFSHTFTGNITSLDFHDHGGYVGIGRLIFVLDPPVPEPDILIAIPFFFSLVRMRRPTRTVSA